MLWLLKAKEINIFHINFLTLRPPCNIIVINFGLQALKLILRRYLSVNLLACVSWGQYYKTYFVFN